jgi:2-keto-4-pentenoate hydratase/2-oxohepta-3-ene-1,7-dioic acid hydratase in catechol pathway
MKIFGIGSNYKKFIAELGIPTPETPLVFTKLETSLLKNNEDFYYPGFTKEIIYEIELVVRINKVGKNIAVEFAKNYYNEVAVGVDFTAKDLITELKSAGLPWDLCKAFDGSAPISEFYPLSDFKSVQEIDIRLDLNGENRQNANTSDMLFSVDVLIAHLSKYFTLKTGDLIFTGTPSGIGPIAIGDRIEGYIGGKKAIDFLIK